MHIGTPYKVRIVSGEVLTTEVNIYEENGEHTRYIIDTYCIDKNTGFQKIKEIKEGRRND